MRVQTMSLFFALLSVGALALALASAIAALSRGRAGAWLREAISPHALPLAWAVALVATAGSLYYSEVAHFVPCRLCWYQRIAMYPLALILGIAFVKRDLVNVRRYAIPLASAGVLIAAYHYQLERFPGQETIACALEAPCNATLVWELRFVSIPFMALAGFLAIVALLSLSRDDGEEVSDEQAEHGDARSQAASARRETYSRS